MYLHNSYTRPEVLILSQSSNSTFQRNEWSSLDFDLLSANAGVDQPGYHLSWDDLVLKFVNGYFADDLITSITRYMRPVGESYDGEDRLPVNIYNAPPGFLAQMLYRGFSFHLLGSPSEEPSSWSSCLSNIPCSTLRHSGSVNGIGRCLLGHQVSPV